MNATEFPDKPAESGAAADATPSGPSQRAWLFVIVTVALNMLSFGIIIPVMPSLLNDITGLSASENVSLNGWLAAVFAVSNFLAMPFLGALSDRFGRRPVLLISIGALAVDLVAMGLTTSLAVLFAVRTFAGLFSATVSVANAYIADVTTPEERGRAFGFTGAAFGIGFILGPVVGGELGSIDTRLPFFVAAGCAGLNFLYGLFVLPESLPREDRRAFSWARANPFGALRHFSKLPKVAWFIAAIGLYSIAHSVYPTTWNYHGAIRYGWGDREIGRSLAAVGIGSALVQALVTGWAIKTFGAVRTAVGGLLVSAAALAGYSLAGSGWVAYAVIPFSAFGGVTMPAINTLTSTLTPRNAQGELQGAQSSLQALTLIFSPVMMTGALSTFSGEDPLADFPGAAFLLAAVFTLLALIPFSIGVGVNRRAVAAAAASA